ncbi:hypothetical protein [Belnapia rosea]|uniref:hypothetical protein n=1 Tax=Belnapia rosea TaxID=938405 RepID=UPI0015A2659D|nr:hypothetical protein [Belnapia rosea]
MLGAAGAGLGAAAGELLKFADRGGALQLALLTGAWFAPAGFGMAFGIRLGLDLHLRAGPRLDGTVLLAAGLGGLGGFAAFALGQWVYADTIAAGGTGIPMLWREGFRTSVWGLAGGCLGAVVGPEIPNLGIWRGLAGGLAGGVLACLLFVAISVAGGPEPIARILGLTAFGGLLGGMIVLAEAMLRGPRVEIRWGRTGRVVVALGKTPVLIGSGPGNTVVVTGIARRALGFEMAGGRVICRDAETGSRETVAAGWARRLEDVTVTVRGLPPGAGNGHRRAMP